ncbi:MAG: phosphatase PAP2 family protein [Candidatus Krumholzibacteriia bacterium]
MLLGLPRSAGADSFHKSEARFASGTGNVIYIGLGIGLPMLLDGQQGVNHSLRTLDAVIVGLVTAEVLKGVTREKRPNSGNLASFPSGHTTIAFAIARMESRYHPGQAWAWFLGAGLIGESRVELNQHHVHDVIAGAAIGCLLAEWELHRPHGLLLFPFIEPEGGAVGLQAAAGF